MTIRSRPARHRRRFTGIPAVVLMLGVLFACAPLSSSWSKDFYMYKDRKGVIHFTDAPTDGRFRPFKVRTKVRVGGGQRRLSIQQVKPHVLAAAKRFQLDPALILAVIKVESAFDPNAVSWAGAQGLMQLIPDTAKLMQVYNAFDPRDNIFGGSRYLRLMLDRFAGNMKLALAAYNIGPERVARENKVPNVRETKAYVKLVMRHYERYKKNSIQ